MPIEMALENKSFVCWFRALFFRVLWFCFRNGSHLLNVVERWHSHTAVCSNFHIWKSGESSTNFGLHSCILPGSNVGTLVAFPLSGYLASTDFGWPSIFYVTGGIGFLWALVWLRVGASTPSLHSFISEKEQRYIETSMSRISENEEVGFACDLTRWTHAKSDDLFVFSFRSWKRHGNIS